MRKKFCFLSLVFVTFTVIAVPFVFVGSNTTINPSAYSLTNFTCYWKLDESSGTRNDSSANAQNLTDNNTVGYTTGVKSNAAIFVSTSFRYLSHIDSTTLSTGDIIFSFAFWCKITNKTAVQCFVESGRFLVSKNILYYTIMP